MRPILFESLFESKSAQRVVFILTLSSSIGIYITGLAVSEIFNLARRALNQALMINSDDKMADRK